MFYILKVSSLDCCDELCRFFFWTTRSQRATPLNLQLDIWVKRNKPYDQELPESKKQWDYLNPFVVFCCQVCVRETYKLVEKDAGKFGHGASGEIDDTSGDCHHGGLNIFWDHFLKHNYHGNLCKRNLHSVEKGGPTAHHLQITYTVSQIHAISLPQFNALSDRKSYGRGICQVSKFIMLKTHLIRSNSC